LWGALISTLQHTLGLTVFMVTHDLDSLHTVCDRVAALADGKIVEVGPIAELINSQHPWVKSYFHSDRAHLRSAAAH
jgi:phospholipid/cholesterol/gamma-HCH transport system ATP-binding protein